ncbi:iron chaperone [Labedaea rhizosphaerae]|uniref:Uncharacterized protein YdhG (YjbR/CyaY superfamily) n=1 Tax=Labedaea rhizosphaerae TaxID=598644 RepID=A0A4R6SEH1_LABRH|nr:DUF1801 domain-containing protein [Labedaea rhizosphaerae]TDP98114.1 uncharacterized protein YdhG (YjbR/CyaY superfamily) [Labedaea rhizosphaerae]
MAATKSTYDGFSAEERAAMKEHAQEMKKSARRSPKTAKVDGEQDVLGKIAEMSGTDKELAEALHALVKEHAPALAPRTYYGMPAYALDGKPVCFFKPAAKFKMRYATLEFSDAAQLDDGPMWPMGYALTKMTPAVRKQIIALLKQAVA